jgi:hypothetical protein
VTLQGTAQHFLGAGSPSGLPVYLENATLRAEFEADDAVGVRLARLVHLAGAAPFAWVNDPAAVGQTFALWQARGLLADGTPYSVGPSSAAAFQVRTTTLPPDGDAALLMHWSGVPIPGAAAGDVLDVVVIAYIAATDPSELRWRVTVRRSVGESASIDEIDAPITFWVSPVATRAGSTALESAKRARVLAPNNFQSGLWGNTQESALYQWLPGGIYRQAHPHGTGLGSSHGAWQVQQWCAVAGMDPQHSASYRQILHLGTRDTDGRLKRLLLQGYPTAGVTDGRLGWRVTHIPQWSGYPATDLEADATELGNVYVSRFPVSMAVLRAQSAAWDHDACEYYRDWVRRSGTGGTPRQFAEDRSALRDGRPLLGMILTPHTDSGASLYGKFVAEAAEFGAMLDGAHSAYPLFQFWSNWQKDPATDEGGITLVNPGTDVAAYVDDGLVAAIVAARAAGGRVAIYTYGVSVEIDRGWPEVAGAATQVYQRDGTPALLTAHLWDYGHPDTVAALRLFYAAIAAIVQPDGIYSDSISGGHGFIAYDPPAPLERGHFEHGGRHWQRGKRDILRAIRDALRDHSPVGPADADVFALSEVPEELLFHGHRSAIDATQEGYIPVPGSMALAEEHLRNYGVDDVPPQSRPMTPSTWSQVYHRWRPSFRHPIPLTTVPLIGSGYHPSGSAYPGLTVDECTDLFCYTFATTWVHGIGWLFVQRAEYFDDRLFRPGLTGDAAQLQADVGAFLNALYQRLHPDWVQAEMAFGDLARPLDIHYDSDWNDDWNDDFGGPVHLATNPQSLSRKLRADLGSVTYPGYHQSYKPALTATLIGGPGSDWNDDWNDDWGSAVVAPIGTELIRVDGEATAWNEGDEAVLGSGAGAETVTILSIDQGDYGDDYGPDFGGGWLLVGVPDGVGGFLPLQKPHSVGEMLVRPATASVVEWQAGTEPYQVPRVLVSVWQPLDRSRVVIALVNWSGQSASWMGTFDSAWYGLTDWYAMRELTGPGAAGKVDLVLQRPGLCRLRMHGTPERDRWDVFLGEVPARSVRLIELAPIGSDYNDDYNDDYGPTFNATVPQHVGDWNDDWNNDFN